MERNEHGSIALEFVVVRDCFERLGGTIRIPDYMERDGEEVEWSVMEGRNDGSPTKDRKPAMKLTP